jgi:hypothetical protein
VEEGFSFWLKMAPLAQGVGQKWFFCHNFGNIQLFFNLGPADHLDFFLNDRAENFT